MTNAPLPVCVDASVAATILLPEPTSRTAEALWLGWTADARAMLAPLTFAGEVVSALRRAGLFGTISPDRENAALETFYSRLLPDVQIRVPALPTWRRALLWARELRRAGIYDTIYLAVAEDAGAEFWTCDENLARALTSDGRPLPDWFHLVTPPAAPAP